VRSRLPRGRFWLAAVAVALVLLSLVPPAATYSRRYVFAESLQFLLFATVVPALLVLGAPWRRLGAPGGRGLAGLLLPARPGPRRPGRSRFARGFTVLLVFVGTVIAWRLPASVDALARWPGFAAAEMATLVAAGSALWLELVESPPSLPALPRPLRAVFAAVAMWTIWVLAYILGFSQVLGRCHPLAGRSVSEPDWRLKGAPEASGRHSLRPGGRRRSRRPPGQASEIRTRAAG
jgi:Cytochrome c oxidase caa3 assembly factor (Caa3_CtaG)